MANATVMVMMMIITIPADDTPMIITILAPEGKTYCLHH